MKPTHAPTLIEALARHLCRADGKLPDHPVAYEEGDGIWMLRDQPDGPPVWPEMPLWRFWYEAAAVAALDVVVPLITGGDDAVAG